MQYKLVRLLRLLERYCPDYNVLGEFAVALDQFEFPSPADSPSQTDMLALYARIGHPAHAGPKPAPSNPAALAYLLDKNRFKRSGFPQIFPLVLYSSVDSGLPAA